MKQLLNSFGDGTIKLEDISKPKVPNNGVLIKNYYSAVSVGTERMLVDFGKANYLQKARQQPEKVKEVINKVKTDGFNTTYNAVKSKLDQPIPLGYSSCGEIIAVGDDCNDFEIGDLVISNGAHAEIVAVNKNLVAKIPEGVSLEDAAFTVISSIPLQGVRLLETEIGDTVVITGLGLMGLIASQILVASGCHVIATDFDESKVEMAKSYGVDAINAKDGIDIVEYVKKKTTNQGADKVLITASTKSNEPIMQAAHMTRKRGKIVLVGVVGLDIDRTPFYEKEITFQVSSSYGPGRYDANYEEKGVDYPYGYVRWTENRNFQAILNMIKTNRLSFNSLITHKFKFEEAEKAYEELSNTGNVIGGLFEYNHEQVDDQDIVEIGDRKLSVKSNVTVGVIGAGNYTSQTLLPKIDQEYRLKTIVSSAGLSSTVVGKKRGFEFSTTNIDKVLSDDEINTVIITTRHDTHFEYVKSALKNNKAVFVEKPLALTHKELDELEAIYTDQHIMVGFNRRFSPLIEKMMGLLESTISAKSIMINVNAGKIPVEHWTQDPNVGGGRLIGEACHFIDLAKYISGSEISDYEIVSMNDRNDTFDTFSIILKFKDGSIANINYYANGNKSYPKENVQVNCEDKILEIDNFKILRGYGFDKFSKLKSPKQDKGHAKCINSFLNSTKTNTPLISFEELIEVSRISIDLDQIIRN
ncbi:bi-domain-containing oxidoreductase [Salinicoccus carnicancri]|uniref:bi-domain-containing oxidoreductase n=1 Tax=Salinicoccus carnicancri TaxID=558170 RepID=UPI0002E6AC41|nr:bi-domain-containing oxidoreductase [Salinicoccus carnicancri]